MVIGRSFVLAPGEELNGNLAVLDGTATIEKGSTVTGNLVVMGGKLTLGGTVQGDLVAIGALLVLEEGAVVEGQLASFGVSTMRAPGAVVRGDSLEIPDAVGIPGHFHGTKPRGFGGLESALSALQLALCCGPWKLLVGGCCLHCWACSRCQSRRKVCGGYPARLPGIPHSVSAWVC